jgi:hypothetical protein
MGFPGYGRSIRASLAYVGMAAATASALVVLQSGVAFGTSAAADKITVTPDSGTAATVLEGASTGDLVVGTFTDTGRPGGRECNTEGYAATINWGDGSTSTGTVTCEVDNSTSAFLPTGVFDVTGSHTYADSASENITVSVVDNSEEAESSGAAVKTDTATVNDADVFASTDNSNDGSYSAVEGKSITVTVGFVDDRAFAEGTTRDASITGTINWGDGTAVQTVPATTPASNCECNLEISASHVYDAAAAPYHITVTAKDDGGSTATAPFAARIFSDGKLTADANKSLTATASAAFTSVLGSFTDEAGAQAAAGDFAAMISWGDGSLYSGTVTKTGDGAFSVSGTHTYASAGSKSITATVTDEEGSTVTLHATATVGAAPIVLPATGQPHPTQPAVPVIPLALLILCLASLAVGGRILVKMPR